MNNTLRTALIVIATLFTAGALFLGGMMVGTLFGFGRMMDLSAVGGGGPWRGFFRAPGMMHGYGGMMGGYGYGANLKPLTVAQAREAVEQYLDDYGNPDLKIDEIMIFRSNAYALIVEQSTSIGAFELLVDPATLAVYPEPGPNMMWNLKYGRMGHGGMMGQGWADGTKNAVSAEMPISAEEALAAARDYLNIYHKGALPVEKAEPFYGYYTIDIMRDGSITGMLSVNGFSGQVFFHSWHGDFIEMAGE